MLGIKQFNKMNLEEIQSLVNDPDIKLPISITAVSSKANRIVLNSKIIIPIVKHASFFKTGLDISIYTANGVEIGSLLFTSELGEVNISSLTEDQFIAFLVEGNLNNLEAPYRFLNSYVIVHEAYYDDYVSKYMKHSSLWGDFYHANSSIQTNSHSINVPKITAYDLDFAADIFLENSIRAVSQPFAFERFLKFYHLLELLFDFEVIKKIKHLNIDTDSEKIGELLNDYSSKEIKRLEDILETYCQNIAPIVTSLNKASSFDNLAYDLFYKFGTGKEGNPFNGQEHKLKTVLATGFEEPNLRNLKVSLNGTH
jgi:hypothetical protein